MAFWKQLLVSLVILLVAAGLWVRFFPGAPAMLANWGLDWIPVAPARTPPPGGVEGGQRPERGAPLVVAEPVVMATINDRLSAIGTGRASNSVVVTSFAAGRLIDVSVTSGSLVEAGEIIARLD